MFCALDLMGCVLDWEERVEMMRFVGMSRSEKRQRVIDVRTAILANLWMCSERLPVDILLGPSVLSYRVAVGGWWMRRETRDLG